MKTSRLNSMISLVSVILVILNISFVIYYYFSLPESIHSHFNILGKADGEANKIWVFLLPVLSIITYFTLAILLKKPQVFNFPVIITENNKERLYAIAISMINMLRALLILLFLYLSVSIVYSELYELKQSNIFIFYSLMGLILIVLFIGIKKMYSAK